MRGVRALVSTAIAAALVTAATLVSPVLGGAPTASAAAGDPFPSDQALVFVAQGDRRGSPTTLYQAVQGSGTVTFVRQGTGPAVGYNAIGFHPSDMYLYGINDNNALVRIGQGGAVTNFGQVGLPSSTYNYNQGTFGSGATADVLYVRLARTDSVLYAVDVATRTTSTIALSAPVPNVSDFVWIDGLIWAVYGEGGRLYRIDPSTGAVTSWTLSSLGVTVPANPYGAQWAYGNGNLGISNNVTGTVYQLAIADPTGTPRLTMVSSSRGPANTQNDGASYSGPSVDLGVTKTATPNPVASGASLTYTLTVRNVGTTGSTGWAVNDQLPAQLADPTTPTDGCTITGGALACTGGPLAPGESATITVTGSVDATACFTNSATVVGNEQDPVLANNTDNATVCPPDVSPPSFTVSKAVTPDGSLSPGDSATYTVTVTNTGETPYTDDAPASFVDNLANVVDDAALDPASIDASAGTATYSTTDRALSWSGPLGVGATATVSYTVTVGSPPAGDHLLTNAVIPGGTGTCATATSCTTETPVSGFTVSKSAAADPDVPGHVVYTVTVSNVGRVGYTDASPASFVDDLTDVVDDATYVAGSATATAGTVTVAGSELTWSGPLPVDGTVTVTYTFDTATPTSGNHVLHNVVAPGQPDGSCAVSCETVTPERGFAVSKAASRTAANPGGTLTYTVTVTNTGAVAFTAGSPATFTDDLSDILDDATVAPAGDGITVTGSTLTWRGPLDIGETVLVRYTVTVDDPDQGDHHLRNSVVPGTDGACADVCTTDTPVASYTVAKSVDVTRAAPGDRVVYTVTVTNTGAVSFSSGSPATFTDDLSDVLDDAEFVSATAGATVEGTTLSWAGALPVDSSVDVTYTVAVRSPDAADHRMTNVVVPGTGGSCVAEECTTTTPVSGYTVTKAADPASTVPGGTVTYTVTVRNVGQVAYTDDAPATFSDDLSGVVDDADVTATGDGLQLTGTTLGWSGALGIGQTLTLTYAARAHDPVTGDRVLRNIVTPTGEDGACAGPCTTRTPITVPTPSPSPSPSTPTPTTPTSGPTTTVPTSGGAGPDQDSPSPVPGAAEGGGSPGTGSWLATTGADALVPALVAAALLVLGGLALIVRRRLGNR